MKLEEYEIICSDCSGSGLDQTRIYKYSCGKCNGEGKLDWIENVVGKRKPSRYVRPGSYTVEVDLSSYVPKFITTIEADIRFFLNSFMFELADEKTLNQIKGGLEAFKKDGKIKDFRILPGERKNKILFVKHNDDMVLHYAL